MVILMRWTLVAAAVAACNDEQLVQTKAALGPTQHYKMVDELTAGGLSQWKGKELKVHGWVLAGTIREGILKDETQLTFVLTKEGKKVRIFSEGPKPETLRDQSEVVVTGHLIPAAEKRELARSLGAGVEGDLDYVMAAKELQTKCPSKYEAARANKDLPTKFE